MQRDKSTFQIIDKLEHTEKINLLKRYGEYLLSGSNYSNVTVKPGTFKPGFFRRRKKFIFLKSPEMNKNGIKIFKNPGLNSILPPKKSRFNGNITVLSSYTFLAKFLK